MLKNGIMAHTRAGWQWAMELWAAKAGHCTTTESTLESTISIAFLHIVCKDDATKCVLLDVCGIIWNVHSGIVGVLISCLVC